MITGILVPGVGYTTQGPVFDIADAVLAARGCAVEEIEWRPPAGLPDAGAEPFVRVHVTAALGRLAGHARPVLIGKSLGSYAAALAAERRLPAIWLTPILTDDDVAAAIGANPAPSLLIGGTDDRAWVPEVARASGKQVLEIPGADHGLRVPGPVRRYAEVLGLVGTAMEEFLDALAGDAGGAR